MINTQDLQRLCRKYNFKLEKNGEISTGIDTWMLKEECGKFELWHKNKAGNKNSYHLQKRFLELKTAFRYMENHMYCKKGMKQQRLMFLFSVI